MMIVSFAWTVSVLLAGRKTVTRRDWPDDYARKFRVGDRVQAWDKSPRSGGKQRAIIRIEDLWRDPLPHLIYEPDYGRAELAKEGGLWPSPQAFISQFGALKHGDPLRVQFRLESVEGQQLVIPLDDQVPAVHAEFCRITGQQYKLSLFQLYWRELLTTHGFSADDVSLVARYLVRQVKLGKRNEGALKLPNVADPVKFSGDLALAKMALPPGRRVSAPTAVDPTELPPEEVGKATAARLADFRKSLRRQRA